jgi:SAM-dependent methyltransferase
MPKHGHWVENGEFMHRHYDDYQGYLFHQSAKFEQKFGAYVADRSYATLADGENEFRAVLRERLHAGDFAHAGMSVLCLGARAGCEVKAFHDLGCFAVGVDIEPGPGNRFVLYGDMHSLQFPDMCLDVVYTNSLDHVNNIGTVAFEIKRVLKYGGLFIADIVNGSEEGAASGAYESFYWKRVEDVVGFLEKYFVLEYRVGITYPWAGEHVVMRRS